TPKRPLFYKLESSEINDNDQWWERRQAVAYIFGIHHVFALMSPFLTEEKLIELVNLGTELEISQDALDRAVGTIIG
ncbi:MAG: hypothetical protein JRF40_12260, partial [Deltaproteobacteria bacterium]|nr:hypothetical protein [Deltaproteobacteria bacterium]